MSFLADVNHAMASLMPVWIWDWLQIIFGTWVLLGVMAQRAQSPRFQRSSMTCPLSTLTVILGQFGLWLTGIGALIVLIDGLTPNVAPPRSFVILFMLGFGLIQMRALHEAFADILHKPVKQHEP